MIRKAATKDASRLAEILIFVKRTAYRLIFNNDKVSFNEMQLLNLALAFRDNIYEKHGFKPDGISKLEDGTTEIILRYKLEI
jgi:hypothetical protein